MASPENPESHYIHDVALAHDMALAEAPFQDLRLRAKAATKKQSCVAYFAVRAEMESDKVERAANPELPEINIWDYLERKKVQRDLPRGYNSESPRLAKGMADNPEAMIAHLDHDIIRKLESNERLKPKRLEQANAPDILAKRAEQQRQTELRAAENRRATQLEWMRDYSIPHSGLQFSAASELASAVRGSEIMETLYPFGEGQLVRKERMTPAMSRILMTLGCELLQEYVEPEELVITPWKNWDLKRISDKGDELTKKFHGTATDFRFTKLPVTPEWAERYFAQKPPVDDDKVRRVQFAVDLKPTGKPGFVSRTESAVYLRLEERGPMLYATTRQADRVSGEGELESLQAEARAIAFVLRNNPRKMPTLRRRQI